jgi:hypothetical protein
MLKDYEYVRGGTANVFCAVEPKAGVYINKVTALLLRTRSSVVAAVKLPRAG